MQIGTDTGAKGGGNEIVNEVSLVCIGCGNG